MKIINPNSIEKSIIDSKKCTYQTVDEAISQMVNIKTEYIQYSTAEHAGNLLRTHMHPLVSAIHTAYCQHLPLVLTPDSIWYCISSAVAIYINKTSEEVRYTFVNHEGKERIKVRRDEFVFGRKNPWNEVVDEFTEKIKQKTKNNIVDLLQSDFTTTNKISHVVSQIVIMDAMQKYFEYYCVTLCGIPEIRLSGEKNDWERIKSRANELVKILPEFKEWAVGLNEILDNFINTFDDKIDKDFWNSIYKLTNFGSGGSYITGWIIHLFPYLDQGGKNSHCWNGNSWRNIQGNYQGMKTNQFRYHMNQVPFTWNYHGKESKMLDHGPN